MLVVAMLHFFVIHYQYASNIPVILGGDWNHVLDTVLDKSDNVNRVYQKTRPLIY